MSNLSGDEKTNMTSAQMLALEDIVNTPNTSIDSIAVAPALTIEEERAQFKFPKDFSFKDESFRNKVDHLYGRKHFSINYASKLKELTTKLLKSKSLDELKNNSYNLLLIGRAERKAKSKVRQDYHQKCKEYFIEHNHWPKRVAGFTSKLISLPKCKENKTLNDYLVIAFPAALVGNLPKRYVEPMAKLMDVETKFVTASSIVYDIANLAGVGYWAYSIWTGDQSHVGPVERLVEQFYGLFNAGETGLKWLLTINIATRVLEIPVRLGYYINYKSHTLSPAAAFPLNPNPFDGPIFTYLLGHDLYRKLKESTSSSKNEKMPQTKNQKSPNIDNIAITLYSSKSYKSD